ncbi:enoyl-CoA hydratase/isomerase family protein [Diaphorobacter aerolatus]|uniref:Enoyl-CoA hydratase/isomerase family protein n=1 Tax=Diaphorobacter aerolatus TaxID=1288495 RepID=A0A7H0GGE4_9BURK|nr:enoyl-CoA hydratase/isomerase family protein [Diaphorobacter aerolatus]QNP47360.1 enoyl-CoA hydratase/isomerase family protein [Diaphorobacter aerolatus]
MSTEAASSNAVLLIGRHASHWTLTLNRPDKRNALSAALVEALLAAVSEASAAQAPLLVLQGAGVNLSAGFDFTGYEAESEGDLLLRFVRIETLLQQIAYGPFATLALAHGNNFGAGVDLFAACRHRWCAPQSRFRMPGLKFGLALGTRRLASLVGESHAYSLLETTASFGDEHAQRIGFVQGTKSPDEWPALIAQVSASTLSLPPEGRRLLRELTRSSHRDRDGDMAALVASASAPGLKERIRVYREESARAAHTP